MVPRIEPKITGLELNVSKPASQPGSSDQFMDTLADHFREATAKMKELPGMPGVYVIDRQQQTLDSLQITQKLV